MSYTKEIAELAEHLVDQIGWGASESDVIQILQDWQSARATDSGSQGVPEEVEALVRMAEQACQDNGNQTLRESEIAQQWLESLNYAINLLSTSPGNGWVRCEDRLPTEDDADFEYRLWCWFPERGDMKLVLLDQVMQAHMSGLKVQFHRTNLTKPQRPTGESK